MTDLPVREMVLYKHGVGFFVREGKTRANQVALTFRQDEINDVLKSLAVFDKSGGQVLGIHYQTPMDKMARLANSSIRLSETGSLRDLLRDLRGRQATFVFTPASGASETVTGRVLGLDYPPGATSRKTDAIATLVAVQAEVGQVKSYNFDALRSLTLHDDQSAHDLTYFLDTSAGEDARRTVNVRLSEGEHDLIVYYVAPSPTWRVSYRLVAESDEDGETGAALLQGWGLFDNRLEEDLENVRVTLVAGQPISFVYDLYASQIPQRPTVKDETRVAPGPVEYEGASLLRRMARTGARAPQLRALATPPESLGERYASAGAPYADLKDRVEALLRQELEGQSFSALDPKETRQRIQEIFNQILAEEGIVLSRQERERLFETIVAEKLSLPAGLVVGAAQSTQPVAEGREAGEFFQYVVTTPVSVKRGESTHEPILGSEVTYQRELLYNGAKLPRHPVAALRFDNTTGLTLERGPVTVVEDGDYKGEAVIPFTKDQNQVYLPYAVELGVTVTEHPKTYTVTHRLTIEEAYLVYEEHAVREVAYLLENTTANPLTVTLEAPIRANAELFDTPDPAIETANERRWKVDLPAHGKMGFVGKERTLTRRRQELRRLSYHNLQEFMEKQWLDQGTLDQLSEMLANLGRVQEARAKSKDLDAEKAAIYTQQEQLRANMQALSPTGDEAVFRKRVVGQLESSQNRLGEIDAEIEALKQQVKDAEAEVEKIIAGLGAK